MSWSRFLPTNVTPTAVSSRPSNGQNDKLDRAGATDSKLGSLSCESTATITDPVKLIVVIDEFSWSMVVENVMKPRIFARMDLDISFR